MIAIDHAAGQTIVVFLLLAVCVFVSTKRLPLDRGVFPVSVTSELKGLAILLVIFSHVGNFLVADHRFLAPLSGLSQAGVDIFLILSGFGLTVSNLKRPQKPLQFYARLFKLFVPFWIVLTVLLLADFLFLGVHYGTSLVLKDYLGIFLTSDLQADINAPFWFMTFIAGYYLLFPLVFRKDRSWLSALVLLVISAALAALNPAVLGDIMFLYKLHYLAFPAGMLLAWYLYGRGTAPHFPSFQNRWWRYGAIVGLIAILFALNPGTHVADGAVVRQLVNMTFAGTLILLFNLKGVYFRLLGLLGAYSFEIYLLHWPLVSRYDFLYTHLPAWAATMLYLVLFTALGYGLQRIASAVRLPRSGTAG